MLDRFVSRLDHLPEIDKRDMLAECPLFNNGKTLGMVHQQQPEFSHSSYLRLRSLEEAMMISNYLGG